MSGNADEGRSIFGVIPNWVVAVAVSCFGSLLTVSGFVLQKQAVQAPKGRRPWPKVGDIVFSPRWMIGFFLAGVLPLPGALIAYALAPISLLAPLSGFTILVNFVVAPWLLGEKLQLRADVVASMCILVGIVLTTTTGNHDHGETSAQMNLARLKDLFIQDVFIIAFICLIIIVLAVSACIVVFQNNIEASAAARQMNPPVHHMLLPATLYAGFGCLTNIGLKAVAELMTAGVSIFVIGAVAIIGVAPCAYLQLNFLNRGLRLYLQVIFFPVASALLIVTITLYGALFYEEYKTFEGAPIRCVLFCAGVLLVVIGINMFQFRKHQHNQVVDSTTAPASSNEIKQGNLCSSLHPVEISHVRFSSSHAQLMQDSNTSLLPKQESSKDCCAGHGVLSSMAKSNSFRDSSDGLKGIAFSLDMMKFIEGTWENDKLLPAPPLVAEIGKRHAALFAEISNGNFSAQSLDTLESSTNLSLTVGGECYSVCDPLYKNVQTKPETVVTQLAKLETEPPEQQPRKGDESEQTFEIGDQDRKRVDDFMACNNAPGWKPISNIFGPKTTKKFMLQQEGNPLVLIKGVSPVKCKAKTVYEFFSDASKWQESMKIADVMFVGGKVLTIYDAHHCAYFAKFKTPPGVINRDFCFEDFHSMLDENTAVTLAHSVERADCPPSDAHWSWVRGEIKVSGYMARDDTTGDGCELTYIVQVDPKGWLPSWVVNIVAADQADNVTRIAQYFKKKAT